MTPAELTADIAGTVVLPGDDTWDSARLFHSGIGSPDLVVRAANVDDVRAAVSYAASAGLAVGVRGGGHSVWGTLPGGVVVDLGELREVTIDADAQRASIGGGATWGEVAATLGAHRLAISSGDTASVGVGGLTLGGGIGWMVRRWGLACDQLVGAQVVTAAGDVVDVSADAHPELFWALRGGGGNFGVVTRFDFQTHPLPAVVFLTLRVDVDRVGVAAGALRALRDTMRGAPRELTVTYMDVPPMDPSAPVGATISAVWIGDDLAAARSALAQVAEVDGVTEEDAAVCAYSDILLDAPEYDPDNPPPDFVGGNALFTELSDDAIDRLTSFRRSRPAAVLFLRSLGGAYGDVPQDATPFPSRNAQWFAMSGAFGVPGVPDADGEALAQHEWAAIEALGAGSYGNFYNTVDPQWAHKMYPDAAWARLASVKSSWDPQNLFRFNYNVPPA